MTNLEKKLSTFSIQELKNLIIDCTNDLRAELDIVMDFAFKVLETKISEEEFISFCEAL